MGYFVGLKIVNRLMLLLGIIVSAIAAVGVDLFLNISFASETVPAEVWVSIAQGNLKYAVIFAFGSAGFGWKRRKDRAKQEQLQSEMQEPSD